MREKRDKDRRSINQKETIAVRVSERTKKKLAVIARRERRSVSGQAALYIERALRDSTA